MQVRFGVIAIATAAALVLGPAAFGAEEAKKPDATIQFSGGSVAAGIGYSWGSGTLTFQGKEYPIEVKGLSAGAVGVTSVTAHGKVYNLKKLEDFDGNYTAASAGATVAGGGSVTAMRNQNGVVVEAVSTTEGASISLAAAGVRMSVKK
jgi:hypothetical protein